MSHLSQQINIQNKVNSEAPEAEKTSVKVVDVSIGKKFNANTCKDYNIYLIKGKISVKRIGMIDMIVTGNGEWNVKDSLFNENDRDSYVRCETECQLLLIPIEDIKIKDNNSVAKRVDSTSAKAIEVSVYDLDRPYEDTVVITPEKSKEIKDNFYSHLDSLSDEKTKSSFSFSSFGKAISQKFKRKAKNVSRIVAEKVPEVMDSMALKIDESLAVVEMDATSMPAKQGTFDFIGQWKAVDYKLPNKSGIYYVSNGKDVDVIYFNKARGVFHNLENIEILFWSSKKVNLK